MKDTYSVAAAVNNEAVLERCLLASPRVGDTIEFRAYRSFSSASLAYNQAIADCQTDILVLAHQDVYLPTPFFDQLRRAIDAIEAVDREWAVAGLIGIDDQGTIGGEVWSTGIGKVVGNPIGAPMKVEAVDEMVLVIRKSSGIRFDDKLPGFHLYGLDVIQEAKSKGCSSWVINAPAVHHSKPLLTLDATFRRAWAYERKKWWSRLPVRGLICDIETSKRKLWIKALRMRWRSRNRRTRVDPVTSPCEIAKSLGWEA